MTSKPAKYRAPPAIRQRAKELRWRMTPAEIALWERLQNKALHGLKFRRQHPLHHFILDFYCHAHRLVIEIDGGVHDNQQAYDQARTEWLTQRDFKVIRFSNDEVLTDIETVLQRIAQVCDIDPL
jgi:very-short-patch-repair endonuclease